MLSKLSPQRHREHRGSTEKTESDHSTKIIARSSRNFRSLMPRTIIKCSGRRKGPYCSRCATIRSAMPWPIPGSFSSSNREALLMFIDVARSALGKSGLNRAVEFFGRGSVAQAEVERSVARMTSAINGDCNFAGGRFCFTYASDGS